jgi:hypothetical protein
MKVFQRRQILRLFASAAAAPLTSQVVSAQRVADFPRDDVEHLKFRPLRLTRQ